MATPHTSPPPPPPPITGEERDWLKLITTLNKLERPVLLDMYTRAACHEGKVKDKKLLEFLESKGFTKKKLKEKFNKDQRKILDVDPSGKKYDFSLLYLCITLLPGPAPGGQLDALLEKLKAVKDFRNELLHGELAVSPEDYKNKTEELRKLLKDVYSEGKDVFNIDEDEVDNRVKTIDERINYISDNLLDPEDITSYNIDLIEQSGKQELVELFGKRTNVNPVSFIAGTDFLLDIDTVFTRIQGKEERGTADQDIPDEDILKLAIDKHKRIILIDGVAGAGKTTFLIKLLSDWKADKDTIQGLTNFLLLFHIEGRNQHIWSLAQLVQSQMPDTAKKYRGNDMIKCVQQFKVLMLVDGLDELNKASKALIQDVLCNCNFTVVCTTRPERVDDFYKTLPPHLGAVHLQLVGIPAKSRVTFAEKYHNQLIQAGKSTQSTQELVEYLESMPRRLKEYLRLPMNLVFLSLIWAEDPSTVKNMTTATQLYSKVKDMTTEKLVKRLIDKPDTVISARSVKRNIEKIFKVMCQESFVSLKVDSLYVSEEMTDNLEQTCQRVNILLEEVTGAFFITNNTYALCAKVKSCLSFSHKGVQDFYGALHIRDSLQGERPNMSQGPRTIREVLEELHKDDLSSLTLTKYQNVLVHLTGILYVDGGGEVKEDKAEELVLLLHSSGMTGNMTDRSQWVDLINGVKCDTTFCKYVAKHIPQLVTGSIVVTDSSVSVYTTLLPLGRPVYITVNIDGDPDNIPHMVDLMKVVAAWNNCVVGIYMNHHWKHPDTCSPSLDAALQDVFKRHRVWWFEGQLSGAAVRSLPHTVEILYLVITDTDPDLAPALTSLCSRVRLSSLWLHVPVGVPPALLPGPLPLDVNLHLLLSGVNAAHIDWAAQVSQQLQAVNRDYDSLRFPRCLLSDQELGVLASQLRRRNVRATTLVVQGDKEETFPLSGYT
ncbi:uncharacterized protein LOC121863601, partial [Homarus americanus]|uniref:uncharacterized protein LOC121863601 n=1 Tax=Homarus americanus TaxID=6706 RepID=UPI001C495B32